MNDITTASAMTLIGQLEPGAKAGWLTALRDPNSRQTTGRLRSADFVEQRTATTPALYGYCCLGLFAEKVAGCQFSVAYADNEQDVLDEDGEPTGEVLVEPCESDTLACLDPASDTDVNESELLAQSFADRYGITAFMQGILSKLNDWQSITYYSDNVAAIEACTLLFGEPTQIDPAPKFIETPQRDKVLSWSMGKMSFAQIADVVEKIPARAAD